MRGTLAQQNSQRLVERGCRFALEQSPTHLPAVTLALGGSGLLPSCEGHRSLSLLSCVSASSPVRPPQLPLRSRLGALRRAGGMRTAL